MTRIESEKRVVEMMVRFYCRRREGNVQLCSECARLIEYAHERLDRCRRGEGKPTCRRCPVHCYNPAMRQQIREVMRWAAPRLLLRHPLTLIRHTLRERFARQVSV